MKVFMDRVADELRKRFGKKTIFYAGSMAGGTFLERAVMWAGIKGKVNEVRFKNSCQTLL